MKSMRHLLAVSTALLFIIACGKKNTTTPTPSINSISPTGGLPGIDVVISGSGFDPNPANNTVKFNGVVANVKSATITQLVVTAPATATSGAITVSTANGTATGPVFSYFMPPTVTAISPTKGRPGTLVTITGTNFKTTASANTVKFENVVATVVSATATTLTAIAPNSATSTVSVTTNDGIGVGPIFTYVPAPVITSVDQRSGSIGEIITIDGENFDPDLANDTVRFNGVTAVVLTANSFELRVTVPIGATAGNLTLSTPGGATNAGAFAILTTPAVYTCGKSIFGTGFWVNNTFISLTDALTAEKIFVSGNDIYVCGQNFRHQPAYWKNGIETVLPIDINDNSGDALSIFVKDNSVYVAGYQVNGYYGNSATLWTNGKLQVLGTAGASKASTVVVSNGDVYVSGSTVNPATGNINATVWKNTVPQLLVDGGGYKDVFMSVVGNDVYVCGTDISYSGIDAHYWKNNIAYRLPGGAYNINCTGIGATAWGDVYISGTNYFTAVFWKNGTENELYPSIPYDVAFVTGVSVSGTDVYICGYYQSSGAFYWINGNRIKLQDALSLNGIFVKS